MGVSKADEHPAKRSVGLSARKHAASVPRSSYVVGTVVDPTEQFVRNAVTASVDSLGRLSCKITGSTLLHDSASCPLKTSGTTCGIHFRPPFQNLTDDARRNKLLSAFESIRTRDIHSVQVVC